MGWVPSFAANERGRSAAYSLNVGNLCDTGHTAEATPAAATAETGVIAVVGSGLAILE